MTGSEPLTDAQLDAALDLLRPPAPSAGLESRVNGFAPLPFRVPEFRVRRMRLAIAASLVLAAATGAFLHVALTGATVTTPTAATATGKAARTTTAAAEPPTGATSGSVLLSEEIHPPEITLVDLPAGRAATEPISVAGLPLD